MVYFESKITSFKHNPPRNYERIWFQRLRTAIKKLLKTVFLEIEFLASFKTVSVALSNIWGLLITASNFSPVSYTHLTLPTKA